MEASDFPAHIQSALFLNRCYIRQVALQRCLYWACRVPALCRTVTTSRQSLEQIFPQQQVVFQAEGLTFCRCEALC
ncbi:hypothetical protein GOODEAATRI_023281 [Goodea atripinnis]|uniref:Uncharacterized protein n=1 Tax=Goodea atripinnis TaxID=208336 RepID=A0ABV0P769_9TELE